MILVCMALCFTIVALPMYILLAKSLDDRDSTRSLYYEIPSYITLGFFLSVIMTCCCFSSSHFHTVSGAPIFNSFREMSTRDFLSHCVVQYGCRIASIIYFVCLIWFARNLSLMDEGDSYKEAFKPLWVAETSLGLVGVPILIGIALYESSLTKFIQLQQPFRSLQIVQDEVFATIIYILIGAIWVVCLSVSSVLLPCKLDDDDSFTWNQIFSPIWVAYGTQFLLFCVIFVRTRARNAHNDNITMLASIALLNLPTFLTMLLMHVKLENGGMSWMDVFIPMIIQHSLFVCVILCAACKMIKDRI